jgi:hypothetical protein
MNGRYDKFIQNYSEPKGKRTLERLWHRREDYITMILKK